MIEETHPTKTVPKVQRNHRDLPVRVCRTPQNELHQLQLTSIIRCPSAASEASNRTTTIVRKWTTKSRGGN